MPFIFLLLGIALLVTGVKGNASDLYALVKGDFTGDNNFLYWMFAILVLGSLGYVKTLQPLSRWFIILVVVVLFLHNRGFFAQFQKQVFGTGGTVSSNTPSQNLGILKDLGIG